MQTPETNNSPDHFEPISEAEVDKFTQELEQAPSANAVLGHMAMELIQQKDHDMMLTAGRVTPEELAHLEGMLNPTTTNNSDKDPS